jgi:hypothetical protein
MKIILFGAAATAAGIIVIWFRTWKRVERIKQEIEEMERE